MHNITTNNSIGSLTDPRFILHCLLSLPSAQPDQIRKILNHLGSADKVWSASISQLRQCGVAHQTAERLHQERSVFNQRQAWEELYNWQTNHNLRLLDAAHQDYPKRLAEIADAPALLYIRGQSSLLNALRCVAVVGSRRPTSYGKQVTNNIVRDLIAMDCVVVSGLAFGIDRLAHTTTLSNNGLTVAVLAAGVLPQDIAPQTHRVLAETIVQQGGLLVSEFPPGNAAAPYHFPLRNRIIAGLCQATVVVEAANKSGSLITAQLAVDYNREVLAVPGSILSPLSTGTNQLITRGAKPWLSIESLHEEFPYWPSIEHQFTALPTPTPQQQALLGLLSDEPCSLEKLIEHSNMPAATVIVLATELELAGHVRRLEGTDQLFRVQ